MPIQEGSASATFTYTDFRNFDKTLTDLSISGSILDSNGRGGFTMYAEITGIPKWKVINKTQHICSLVVSFGDPNGGPRIGKRINFGPAADYEIPDDGRLVAATTIGINNTTTFGQAGGTSIVIPVGFSGGTIAGYLHPGSLSADVVYSGTLAIVAGSIVSLGSPTLVAVPTGPKITDIRESQTNPNNFFLTIEFDYTKDPADTPDVLDIVDGVSGNVNAGATFNPLITHYIINTPELGPGNYQFYVRARNQGTSAISPTSNSVVVPAAVVDELENQLDAGVAITPSFDYQSSAILIGSHSGVYTLVPNKTNDTIFINLPGILTGDVKIPNPFIKSGLIP